MLAAVRVNPQSLNHQVVGHTNPVNHDDHPGPIRQATLEKLIERLLRGLNKPTADRAFTGPGRRSGRVKRRIAMPLLATG